MGPFEVGIAHAASTLGWAQTITTVANEVRAIGFVCIGLSVTLLGIFIAARRRMEELGDNLSAISIGAVLVSTGLTATAALVGGVAANPAVLGAALAPSALESLTTVLSFWAWQGPVLAAGVSLWRRVRRG